MARQRITLPTNPTRAAGNSIQWPSITSRNQISTALVDGGGDVYLREIRVRLVSGFLFIRMQFAETASGTTTSRQDLTSTWEGYAQAVTFESGGRSIVLPGPTNAATTTQDEREPYTWHIDNATIEAAWRTFESAYRNGNAIDVVLDDGVAPDLMPTAPAVRDVNAVAGTATRVILPAGSGGDGTLTYSVSTLPTGWSFDTSSRVLSGSTSTVVGNNEITYTVTDADGDTDTSTFRIIVTAPDTEPTAPAVADVNAIAGTATMVTLPPGTGGNAPLRYSVSALPTGWSFNNLTRVLSGSTAIVAGTTEITYTVTDSDGDTDDTTFDIVVEPPLALTDFVSTGLTMDMLALLAVSGSPANVRVLYQDSDRGGTDRPLAGELGLSTTQTLISQIRWDTTANQLIFNDNDRPSALNLGTYFGAGGAGRDLTFYLQTKDDGVMSFTVADNFGSAGGNFLRLNPPSAVQTVLDQLETGERFIVGFGRASPDLTAPNVADVNAIAGTATRVTLPVGAGGTGRLTYSVSQLPTGWSFDSGTRVLSGSTSIVAGTTTITYTVTDAGGATDTDTFDIVVVEPDTIPTAPNVRNVNAIAGTAMSVILPTGSGGNAPLMYSVSPLPTGWTFSANTRVLRGSTSIVVGNNEITYTVTDADGDTDTATFRIIVTAADTEPTAPAVRDVSAVAGTAIEVTLPEGSGGNAPLTYSVSSLPTGWSFNTNTRVLSGSSSIVEGTNEITYTVRDADGDTDDSTFNIVVAAADTSPAFSPASANETAVVGQQFSFTRPDASGGNGVLAYTVSPNSGRGLTATATAVQGSPDSAGPVTFTWTATDEDGDTGTFTLNITVNAAPPPSDLMPTAPSVADVNAVAGRATNVILPVGSGGDPPLTYSVSMLPTGWSFAPLTRELSGSTAIVEGTNTITYTVTDSDGDTDETTFDIIVAAMPPPPSPDDWIPYPHSGFETEALVLGLEASKRYELRVRPYRQQAADAPWVSVLGTTKDKPADPAPPMPEGVVNQPADTLGSFLVAWTSSGDYFTQIEWDYLESAAWHFEDRRTSYGQNALIRTQQRSTTYRYRVRHVSPLGTVGPWFIFS